MKSIRHAIGDSLFLSLSSDQIRRLVPQLIPGFDLYRATGFDPGIGIPKAVALDCALDSFPDDKAILDFLAHVMKSEGKAVAGSVLQLRGKAELMASVEFASWKFDEDNGRFVRDQSVRTTLDWGFMVEGQEYPLTFASLDLVGSSRLAQRLSAHVMEQTLLAFREYIRAYVEIWNGRLWMWSGDGGLLVFQGDDAQNRCVIAMVACLLNLPVFLLRKSRLPENVSLQMRIGIHEGEAVYQKDLRSIFSKSIRQTEEIQAKDCPVNGIALSEAAHSSLRSAIAASFVRQTSPTRDPVWLYKGRDGR